MTFDRVAILDWSAAGKPKTGKDSIWLGITDADGTRAENIPTRHAAEARLNALIQECLSDGKRILFGVDFSLGYPAGFGKTLTGSDDPFAIWSWLADKVKDAPDNANTHRAVAATINRFFAGDGPFWGNGTKTDIADLPRQKPPLPDGLSEWRATEQAARDAGLPVKSCWQLSGAGSVGAQSLTGLPMLARLRATFSDSLSVWPFETPTSPIVIAEVYPSLLSTDVKACVGREGVTPDEAQVRLLSQALFHHPDHADLIDLPTDIATTEGWILGLEHQTALRAALPATVEPPRLKDDCFAMPQGVDWVPVDEALSRLKAALHPVKPTRRTATRDAAGLILAQDAIAERSNPPRPNSAVDGYGFAHTATGSGPQRLPLVEGRAAAGQPFEQTVPNGTAIRILTGAILPDGVDTVVLEEDTSLDNAAVVFDGPVKPFANTRKAGEDVAQGDRAIAAGTRLRAPDIALLSALAIPNVTTYDRLKVGILSTGDEIIATPDKPAKPHQIYDANRPMLLSLVENWGYTPVDLGHVRDDRPTIAARLNKAAQDCDVILTSGGASAGDEDHVSALLRDKGTLSAWRIALKPGRPLVLATWNGTPVFGLPGNPVAALVCALIFARPAFSQLAGAGWPDTTGFTVTAAFTKSKKPGRREYLRARLNQDGHAEVFKSEGSGRISGLSWADGLVELPDDAAQITPGSPVRYIPYAMLGLT